MKKNHNQKPGKFDLYYNAGFAELIIYPPEGEGLPVYPEDVSNRMKILGIPTVRLQIIVDIIEEASSLPVKLIEWPEGVLLSSRIVISISADCMSAEAIITPPRPGGGEIYLKDVYRELELKNITFGINEKNINRVIADRDYNRTFLIASGRNPVDGHESVIRYHFKTDRLKPFKEMKYGRINLKELNFIQNCQPGDILAELIPAELPIDGYDIFGTKFQAESKGEPASLQCGKNTHLSGNQLVADIKGNVILNEKGIVEVEEVVSVVNVDYETGNIEFDGSVDITGTVADGFSVKATGDVQIGTCIGRAKITSKRNVFLKAGMNGDREGVINCRGNLITKYIESSSISCGGDLLAEEAVMNSQIDVAGSLFLSGRRAELIGGLSIIGGLVHCKKIGNLYDAKTNLIIGIKPSLIEKFFLTQKKLELKRDRLDKLDEQLNQMKTLQPKDQDSAKKIFQAIRKVENEIRETSSEITAEVHELQLLRTELIPAEKSYVLAEDRIFSGVKLSFGLQDHPVPDKGISSSIVYRKGKKIVEMGYNRIKPEFPEELR